MAFCLPGGGEVGHFGQLLSGRFSSGNLEIVDPHLQPLHLLASTLVFNFLIRCTDQADPVWFGDVII